MAFCYWSPTRKHYLPRSNLPIHSLCASPSPKPGAPSCSMFDDQSRQKLRQAHNTSTAVRVSSGHKTQTAPSFRADWLLLLPYRLPTLPGRIHHQSIVESRPRAKPPWPLQRVLGQLHLPSPSMQLTLAGSALAGSQRLCRKLSPSS